MAGLDEAAALHDGEFDGFLNGESLQHRTSLPSVLAATPSAPARAAVAHRWQTGQMAAHPTPHVLGEHHYALTSTWTGNAGSGTSGYRDYRRDVTIEVQGKPDLLASADKPFRGDSARWNPEDLLLASLSECHLLSYLHACVTAGVVVVSYRDQATGLMRENGAGGGAFVEVMLRPEVVVADASMVEAAERAHAQANEWCFIANSMNFPVRHEATVTAQA
ncbi:hypothetical protein GCM10010489_18520 [Microbacterium saperdae]|nr:hypothetical protein GCM10010489_18520 [Microbacterium saperdae]